MEKIRGFEKISFEQFNKDFKGIECNYSDVNLPIRKTLHAAGYDFLAPFDFALAPGEIIKMPTGIKAYMKDDEFLSLIVRSSMGFKYNVRMCNQVGIIDKDYYNNEGNEGHIYIALQNEGDKSYVVKQGEAFVQGIFMKYLLADNEIEFSKEIREGGLGSTNGGDNNG